jgi:hypothetical protein
MQNAKSRFAECSAKIQAGQIWIPCLIQIEIPDKRLFAFLIVP